MFHVKHPLFVFKFINEV